MASRQLRLAREVCYLIKNSRNYPLAGLLLALATLQRAGLLACAKATYGRLRNGFYGLRVMLAFLVFLGLLREPRAEGATRTGVAAVGRVRGLDRAPQVKTIRRNLSELAARGKAPEPQLAIAARPRRDRSPQARRRAGRRPRGPLRYEDKDHPGAA